MSSPLSPASVEELAEAVRSAPRVIAVGAETKPRLAGAGARPPRAQPADALVGGHDEARSGAGIGGGRAPEFSARARKTAPEAGALPHDTAVEAERISTRKLSGIVEYEPSEFTFTALAGTPVREIAAALAERGQYLPFDPMLVEAGATIGGTVASGLSGPGRFRYGGLRDFILCVKFVDGLGRVLRLGSKVVKNSAGFDVPKFMVGSLGRFGVLGEITFKVFPRAASRLTVVIESKTAEDARYILTQAACARWELDALDWLPDRRFIAMRLAGPERAISALADEILARWPGERLPADVADERWRWLNEFGWAPAEDALLKVPITPHDVPVFRNAVELINGANCHISAGGNVAYVSVPRAEFERVTPVLTKMKLRGLLLRGSGPLWLGAGERHLVAPKVKRALDPKNRFPKLDD